MPLTKPIDWGVEAPCHDYPDRSARVYTLQSTLCKCTQSLCESMMIAIQWRCAEHCSLCSQGCLLIFIIPMRIPVVLIAEHEGAPPTMRARMHIMCDH